MPFINTSLQINVEANAVLFIFLAVFVIAILYLSFKTIEIVFVMHKRKPFYVHFYTVKRQLSQEQVSILKDKFSFYTKLSSKEQRFFEHRIVCFIKDKNFIGRDGLVVTEEMKILIAATAVMLTFGFRDYYIGLIERIFIYPTEFYSNFNKKYHQGELNPKLKALVFSWKHFEEGFDIANDNLNLGIHEFTHAIHLNSIRERDVSSTIFQDSFKELIEMLSNNENLRQELTTTRYFRDYAYSNHYEFVAVIIESFIESPKELLSKFPEVYHKVKQMLNFNFAGY